MTRDDVLRTIAEAAASHPRKGWETLNEETGFQRDIMKSAERHNMTIYPHFVACLQDFGLTRFDAVEAFRLARRAAAGEKRDRGLKQAATNRTTAKETTHAAPSDSTGTARTLSAGCVVRPQQDDAAPVQARRADEDRQRPQGNVAVPVEGKGNDPRPGARRALRGQDAKPVKSSRSAAKPATSVSDRNAGQASLF